MLECVCGVGGSRPHDSKEIGKVVTDACLNQVFSPHGPTVSSALYCSLC